MARRSTLGKTRQVTYRMPEELYLKLEKIAESMFQQMPVVLRAAAAEYVKNHRPVRHRNTGIALKWDEVPAVVKSGQKTEPVVGPLVEDEESDGIKNTTDETEYVKPGDTLVSDGEHKG